MNEHRDRWWPSPTAELARVATIGLDGPFRTQLGGELPALQVSYESWGELDDARSNAVLVVHPMTADCHVTGEFAGQPRGWWEDLVGPGRPVDTERFFVVCPDLPGGCYGATGPRFPAPDGEPWLERFPLITPRDVARAQRLFLRELGIERPALVLGPSMGGMIAWEWAIEAGEDVERVAVIAAPLATTPLQIGWNWLQRTAAELDADGGSTGQRVARGVGMLSYRSPAGLAEKFGRTWFSPPGATLGEPGLFNVESWLRQHGKRIAKRYDPWTWRVFARTMDLHDVGEGREGGTDAALTRVRADVLVVGIRSDCLYPCADVRRGAEALRAAGGRARFEEIDSENGHDAFLIDVEAIGSVLRRWTAA